MYSVYADNQKLDIKFIKIILEYGQQIMDYIYQKLIWRLTWQKVVYMMILKNIIINASVVLW